MAVRGWKLLTRFRNQVAFKVVGANNVEGLFSENALVVKVGLCPIVVEALADVAWLLMPIDVYNSIRLLAVAHLQVV